MPSRPHSLTSRSSTLHLRTPDMELSSSPSLKRKMSRVQASTIYEALRGTTPQQACCKTNRCRRAFPAGRCSSATTVYRNMLVLKNAFRIFRDLNAVRQSDFSFIIRLRLRWHLQAYAPSSLNVIPVLKASIALSSPHKRTFSL